ncbi:asparagine-linked glycosylation protein [Planoprotostelium fungivorum]|uniref:UDP-N-acetylglucosamine transferase subunit ALG14 n=1 Tax=Planoprotostelium fungivorum TaxID=1890364 RepID=A0A2P6N6D6_9EUKA|nr:asparagine-linked glycosylation protein [Planoprotostelium fungivorum]PRP80342.1 asparagine-linked glycosylation protein [Planoprotostelium fungivorum]
MLKLVNHIPLDYLSPRVYVVAEGDPQSRQRAELFESGKGGEKKHRIEIVPRTREVGQSWSSTLTRTAPKSLLASIFLLLDHRPDVILCNGPGTCVPFCLASFLLRILRIKTIRILYVESFACVKRLSVSGRILYFIADLFFVQWPHLHRLYPKSVYIPTESEDGGKITVKREGRVLITVGSYYHDDLLAAIDSPEFVRVMKELGYTGIDVQYGRGKYTPSVIQRHTAPDFEWQIDVFGLVDDLSKYIKRSSLVVGHAGAGTILETLAHRKPLIVVPNESLMNNHQIQIVSHSGGFCNPTLCGEDTADTGREDRGTDQRGSAEDDKGPSGDLSRHLW